MESSHKSQQFTFFIKYSLSDDLQANATIDDVFLNQELDNASQKNVASLEATSDDLPVTEAKEQLTAGGRPPDLLKSVMGL